MDGLRVLDCFGMNNIWISQIFLSVKWLSQRIKKKKSISYNLQLKQQQLQNQSQPMASY